MGVIDPEITIPYVANKLTLGDRMTRFKAISSLALIATENKNKVDVILELIYPFTIDSDAEISENALKYIKILK